MSALIPYGRQDVTQEDIDAVIEVLRSDFLTQGPLVPRFESAVASYCNAENAVAVNSATSALHIACLALDLGPGDILWTSPITFVASANCALYCGAGVDFVDIDPVTYNIDVGRLAEKLESAKTLGRLPKVVMAVHLCGQSCEMAEIQALSRQYGFRVIEDASHAIGGRYRDEHIGSCRYSDITVFSFHPVKIITTGEGGMALCNDPEIARRMRRLRSHGISGDRSEMVPRPAEEIWNYQQIEIGFNYRMTDIQAALGLSQLPRLDKYVAMRHRIAAAYDAALGAMPLIIPRQHPDCYSSYHLYPIRLPSGRCRMTQKQFYGAMHERGILVNVHYIPVYRQPFYESLGFRAGYCPEAEGYFREVVSLPIFPGLNDDALERVIAAVKEFVA
jgi:UDP-4-amino-4,6-dideoxy-N-acetyl-beta-L-altrosamine transaminase